MCAGRPIRWEESLGDLGSIGLLQQQRGVHSQVLLLLKLTKEPKVTFEKVCRGAPSLWRSKKADFGEGGRHLVKRAEPFC